MSSSRRTVGIRREDKSIWEKRVPIVPDDANSLISEGFEITVQSSPIRVFEDSEYATVGVAVQENIEECDVVIGVKEIPAKLLRPNRTYVFFAHVIKGQAYNMPMLKQLLDLGCTLIDYEKVTDEKGRRLIFFGRHAGWAGMINTLWTLGERLDWEGIDNPFSNISQSHKYPSLEAAKQAIKEVGEHIRNHGVPPQLAPLVVGFAGYGNVSRGAQEILELLPTVEIAPDEVSGLFGEDESSINSIYKVVYKEEHLVEPVAAGASFELQEYYDYPERYRSKFEPQIPYLTVLVNGIYWESRYPRLVTKAYLRELFSGSMPPRLRVIGDISCDVEGAIECTTHCTEPGDPIYVYDPNTEETTPGAVGEGVVLMAVDILPSELPREASKDFSAVLSEFLPAIAQADYSVSFGELDLPPEIKRAVIVHRGKLTPDYAYLEEYIT